MNTGCVTCMTARVAVVVGGDMIVVLFVLVAGFTGMCVI